MAEGRPLAYQKKKALAGFLFTLPWLLGFIFLFARPLVSSLVYSFSDVDLGVGGFEIEFVGLENFRRAFAVDDVFVRSLTTSLGAMAYEAPIIVIFSLFVAYVLKADFRGRTFVRAVFFLPVIVTTGSIIQILTGDPIAQDMLELDQQTALLQADLLERMMREAGVSQDIVAFLTNLANNIFELSWRCGVQILLCLAGLQTIPRSLYEAASMEGSTGWESFWKITFPMMSPIILVNLVYTVIDTFTDYRNPTMVMINTYARQQDLAYSSALSWVYFLLVFAILGIIYAIVNKRVFYQVR